MRIPTFPSDEAPKLSNALQVFFDWLLSHLRVAWIQVGDYIWDADGDIKVHGLTMETGAGADKVLTCDADGLATWETTAVTGAAGSDTEVQYNDGGEFGAEAGFEYNPATNTLTVVNVTLGGELKGGRALIQGSRSSNASASQYLQNGPILMDANRGIPMARAGSIIGVAGQCKVASSSGGTAAIEVYLDGVQVASCGTLECDDHIGDYVVWSDTVARDTITFVADQRLQFYLKIVGTATIQYPAGTAELQFDT